MPSKKTTKKLISTIRQKQFVVVNDVNSGNNIDKCENNVVTINVVVSSNNNFISSSNSNEKYTMNEYYKMVKNNNTDDEIECFRKQYVIEMCKCILEISTTFTNIRKNNNVINNNIKKKINLKEIIKQYNNINVNML